MRTLITLAIIFAMGFLFSGYGETQELLLYVLFGLGFGLLALIYPLYVMFARKPEYREDVMISARARIIGTLSFWAGLAAGYLFGPL